MQAAGVNGTAAMRQAGDAGGPSPRLVSAAHEFEGQMMKELLKPMTGGDALTGTDDDSDAGAGACGALSEFASETLGQALSARGGFGIATGIIKELSHAGNQHENGRVTKNLNQKHDLRGSK